MIATQGIIDALAERIERVYHLRRPGWHGACTSERVWSVAARVLLGVHRATPAIPADPELFVAAQPSDSNRPDPWSELTSEEAGLHYRRQVRAIVRALRTELTREVRRAEERIGAGQAIGRVLLARGGQLSPLGRFIVAERAGRSALARRFAPEAADQHRACPLYREASRRLLPPGVYPVSNADNATTTPATCRRHGHQVHPN